MKIRPVFCLTLAAAVVFFPACKAFKKNNPTEAIKSPVNPGGGTGGNDPVLPSGTPRGEVAINVALDADGTVRVMRGNDTLISFYYQAFDRNWSLIWFDPAGVSNTGEILKRGSRDGAQITVGTKVTVTGDKTLKIDTRVLVENAQLTLQSGAVTGMFDRFFWADSKITTPGAVYTLSKNINTPASGEADTAAFSAQTWDGIKIDLSTATQRHYAVQDSRGYNYGWELRTQMERNTTFNAGETRTYTTNIALPVKFSYNSTPDLTLNANAQWVPLDWKSGVTSGSALDWSGFNTAAAGSKGFLIRSGDRFVFENDPNKEVRFVGGNVSHMASMDTHASSDFMCDHMRKMGYNVARLHHIDYWLTETTAANSTTLDANRLEKLNYFFAACKSRGIYLILDMFSMRAPRDNEVLSGAVGVGDFKALVMASDSAKQNLFTYFGKLMDTVNPYTGMKWKDDPALAMIDMVNENPPSWQQSLGNPNIAPLLQQAQGGIPWDPNGANRRASYELAQRASVEMKQRLRNMGVRQLITDRNAAGHAGLMLARKEMDFVDNHVYWGMPWSWNPYRQDVGSPLRTGTGIGWLGWTRIQGMPFTVSEHGAVGMINGRGELGLVVGAASAIQRWNGLMAFEYSDQAWKATTGDRIGEYSLVVDPIRMATERALVTLLRRGDLNTSSTPAEVKYISPTNGTVDEMGTAGTAAWSIFSHPIAITPDPNLATSAPNPPVVDGVFERADKKIATDYNLQTFVVRTPMTAGGSGYAGQTLDAGDVGIALQSGARASIWISSLDNAAIKSSHHMLLVHATDAINAGAQWRGSERSWLLNWGSSNKLIENSKAMITIKSDNPKSLHVYRLDLAGNRVEEVPVTCGSTKIGFTAAVDGASNGKATLYYEISDR